MVSLGGLLLLGGGTWSFPVTDRIIPSFPAMCVGGRERGGGVRGQEVGMVIHNYGIILSMVELYYGVATISRLLKIMGLF